MSIIQGLTKTILYVQDMNTQVKFYRDILGLKIDSPTATDNFNNHIWVEFSTGECSLVLHASGDKQLGKDRPKLAFSVDDIETAHQTLTARGLQLSDISDRLHNVKVADGIDPEGNPFSIYYQGKK
ncbi:glyoxalase/bleomycin resistance protein/dioxygenase [Calothrix sp. NIES-4101]|nr:glyoxalase/bleomycin resistance protein/dioxygenase [Calothrix sp. NIES-4101]